MAYTQTFPADPAALSPIRTFVRAQASESGLPDEAIQDLVLAVSEACANAVRHTPSAEVRLTWFALDHGVAIEVQDQGVFHRRVSLGHAEGGLGIPVMLGLMDELTIREGTEDGPGTVVRLVKRWADS